MPYKKISDLPDRVKNNLPEGAQKIYMEAYNAAHEEYDKPSKRRGNATREETASRVAWSAVKKKYVKNEEGNWVKK